MEWLQAYEQLNQREREDFARIINRLLSSTFLVKHQEEARRDYYFAERNEAMLTGYLKLMHWDLIVDRAYGVVQAVNRNSGTRLPLRLMDSVLLLLLRLIYEEKRKELNVTDDIICCVHDVQDKAFSLRVREKAVVEKKYLREAFSLFRRFALIDVLDEDLTAPRTRLKLYPSLLFAVKLGALPEVEERLALYAEGGESTEADDGDQAG